MRKQIVASARAGERATRIAERVLDTDRQLVRMPEHVRDLADAAREAKRLGEPNAYEDAVKRWRGRIERLGQGSGRQAGEYTVRSATQRLVKDLRAAKTEDIDKVVNRWTLDRARYQARLIARTELVESYRESYKRSSDQPYVKGYRWTLSPSHPRIDDCDSYASQDLDGMGPGGYLPGNEPLSPHPADGCSLSTIVDENHFDRQIAIHEGRPEPPKPWLSGKRVDAHEWLNGKPRGFQRKLLGPTRIKYFDKGERVFDEKGKLLPVHVVAGRPKPVREPGPPRSATPLVNADRASMVKPFPPAPKLPAGDSGR